MVLNFEDGGLKLDENAEVVEDAILYINQLKTGTRDMDAVGLSMGGVVLRYALAKMESLGLSPQVRRFVSVDAPQQGAVIDRNLLDFMEDPPFPISLGDLGVPANIDSDAGKQLLVYNPFDDLVPTMHPQFYSTLNAINGDGYPHQTVENVGVSFGTPSPNADIDQTWLTISSDASFDYDFDIEPGSDEAAPGSLLPEEITEIAGFSPVLYMKVDYNLERFANPTFIPYASAHDRIGGISQFDHTLEAEDPTAHNKVPLEIIEPLLQRLGYAPPPLQLTMDGPTTATQYQTSTWRADAVDGEPPYSYQWSYTYTCGGLGGPLDPFMVNGGVASEPGSVSTDRQARVPHGTSGGGPITNAPTYPCDHTIRQGGTSRFFSLSPPDHGPLRVTVSVTDAGGDFAGASKNVSVTYVHGGASARRADGGDVSPRLSSAMTEAPDAVSLAEAAPNPSSATTTVRFGLPNAATVRLSVYDMLGREVALVAEGEHGSGYHTTRFDGSALPSGVYVLRLDAVGTEGRVIETQRLTLAR